MKLRLLLILLTVLASLGARGAEKREPLDSAAFAQLPWYKQLTKNNFRINDPRIHYPKFAKLCVDVYNWGDETFNRYDTTYVVGTGKNWKAMLRSYNWMQSYAMYFSSKNYLRIMSDPYADLGAYLCFMAVSVGYMENMNAIANHNEGHRKSFNFEFCCALFSAMLRYNKTSGGAKITHFGDYSRRRMDLEFDNIAQRTLSGAAYYFFNHRKYSQAAAYSFSKYQLKSAGTWIAGISFSHQRIAMDFSSLPPSMTEHLPSLEPRYLFHYTDYDLLGGYAYNWVLSPRRWLINGTIMPSVGYKRSFEMATDGKRNMFSTNVRAMVSAVYNHRALFAALQLHFEGHLYFAGNYTFFNSLESVSLVAGVRF